jgi:putative ABC transport system ATP-binding protein
MSDPVLLELCDVRKVYGRGEQAVEALKGISLSIPRGQFTTIMGASGSGKSTLLHLMGGLDRPSRGEVRLDGQALHGLSDAALSAIRRRRLGIVFQFFHLLPTLTALENVCLPLLLDRRSLRAVAPRAKDLLAFLGLTHRAGHYPHQLSGGEMQRVAIARALVAEPLLLLADEPTGNLDSRAGREVLELLASLTRERGQTIVMVTHEHSASMFGDRLVQLRDGKVDYDGVPGAEAAAC